MDRAIAFSAAGICLVLASCGGSGGSSSGGSAGTNAGGSGGSGADGGGGSGGSSGGTAGTGGQATGGSTTGGGGTSSAGGTGTGSGTCVAGTVEDCYTGPDGTLGVGICKAGTRKCKDDGTWALCIGQVTPLAETCETAADDDCDGKTNEEGPGCMCVPGSLGPCYTGPAGTENVGVCKSGMGECNADGLGYGDCKGEVLPALENCLAPTDEDCDGKAPACTGTDAWHKRFGDNGAQAGGGVAAWNGGAVVCGTFAGVVDFGGGALTSAGGNDAFLASYDYLGAHLWSKKFGDAMAQSAIAVAVDSKGNVFVVGDYAGKIDLGGGALTSSGLTDVFVAKYDPLGNFVWGKSFGDAKAQNVFAVAADDQGRVAITGMFAGNMNIGGTQLVSAGATDVFLAVLDKDGGLVWTKSFGDAVAQAGKAVAFGPMGEVVVAGDFAGKINLGGGAFTSLGGNDMFLASFDTTGAPLWSKPFGNNGAQAANALAVDAVGNVVFASSFAGKLDFGSGALTSAGLNDIAVARFTTAGANLWAKRFGGAMADNARGVAVDPLGTIVLVGDFTGSVDFGGGALVGAGGTDVVVAKLDALGNHVWSHRAGDAGVQIGTGAAADATSVFATGTFAGAIDFGGGALTSAGGNDVFLVKLSP